MTEQPAPFLSQRFLQGVVDATKPNSAFKLLNKVDTVDWDKGTLVYWDYLRNVPQLSIPSVPYSEAHIVPRTARVQGSSNMVYYREKAQLVNQFNRWLENLTDETNYKDAETEVLSAVTTLVNRLDTLKEMCLWLATTGKLVLDFTDVEQEVDYGFLPSHIQTVAVPFSRATAVQIADDILQAKGLVAAHGRVDAREAYTTPVILRTIVDAFENEDIPVEDSLLKTAMRNEYRETGNISGFLALDWKSVGLSYQDSDGHLKDCIEDRVVIGNLDEGQPIKLYQGRCVDTDAPKDHFGPFIKTYNISDPLTHYVLLEQRFLPVVHKPDQLVSITVE